MKKSPKRLMDTKYFKAVIVRFLDWWSLHMQWNRWRIDRNLQQTSRQNNPPEFFWSSIEGDFAWSVASFPVNKLNAKTLGNCVWSTISILSELKFGRNNDKKVQVAYGGTGEGMMADSRKKISLWFLHLERDRCRYINTLWSYNHL